VNACSWCFDWKLHYRKSRIGSTRWTAASIVGRFLHHQN
jgi:hypothetical protein